MGFVAGGGSVGSARWRSGPGAVSRSAFSLDCAVCQVETLYFHPEFLVTSHMEHWSTLEHLEDFLFARVVPFS